MVLLDPEVKTGLRDPKEEPVYLEILDHSGRPERRVSSVCPGCQVIQEDKAPRVLKDSRDSKEPVERKARGGQQESRDPEDREDPRDPVVKEGRGDRLVKQDQRATQEAMAPQDHPVNGVRWDQRDLLDSLALKVHRVLPERTGCPDTLAKEERLVSKVKLDLPDPQV